MVGGWSLNALMLYLIWVTARTVTKIWDPYEILGVSRVRAQGRRANSRDISLTKSADRGREGYQEALQEAVH